MSQLARHPGVPRLLDLPAGRFAVHDCAPAAATPGAMPGAAPGATPVQGDVLLVPGYTGSKEDFAPILAGLSAAGFRTVAMDLPGQHESPGVELLGHESPIHDEQRAYTVDRLATAVLAVIDALTDAPVHLLGHSFGGLVCRAAAIAAPDRLRSLVLLGSGPSAIGGVQAERLRTLRPVLDSGGMPAVYAAMEELDRHNERSAVTSPELTEFLRRRFLASSAAGLRGMAEALETEPDRVAALRATGVPVLVAYGEGEDAWEPPVQLDMATRLGAEHQVITGALHSPAVEQPERTVQVLTEFWRGI